MSGMEEVLAAHVAQGGIGNGNSDGGYVFRTCSCGERATIYYNDLPDDETSPDKYLNVRFAAHVAQALAEAGFGSQHDAWAEGLMAGVGRSVVNVCANYDNPYPKVSES